MTIRHPLLISVIAGTAGLVVAETIAFLFAGSADQPFFSIWTIPFVAASTAAFVVIHWLAQSKRVITTALMFGIAGGIAGYFYTLFTALMFGPWFGAFSMPVLLCWVATGIIVGCSVPIVGCLKVREATGIIACMSISVIVLSLVAPTIANAAAGGRQVEVVTIRYTAGQQPVRFDDPFSTSESEQILSQSEKHELERLMSGGVLEIKGIGRHGRGKAVSIILVLQGPVVDEQRFPIPSRGTAFIIQEKEDWCIVPAGYPASDRKIVLSDRPYEWNGESGIATGYTVENVDGSREGSDAVIWMK